MAECNDKARNIESYCGPCTKAKRALGQSVVNKGSPQNEAKSVASKKRKHERSPYEQGLCDRYALQCMSQCLQCMSQCICSIFVRPRQRPVYATVPTVYVTVHMLAGTRICECMHPMLSLTIFVRPRQRPEPQSDQCQGCDRGTPQIQRRRDLDQEGSQVYYWVLLPNPVLQPRPPAVSCATA